jgi:ATP-dependent DNA ligase
LRAATAGSRHSTSSGIGGTMQVFLCTLDLIGLDGDDLRPEPLAVRKAALASLRTIALQGLRFNEHMDEPGGRSFSSTPAIWVRGNRVEAEGLV